MNLPQFNAEASLDQPWAYTGGRHLHLILVGLFMQQRQKLLLNPDLTS